MVTTPAPLNKKLGAWLYDALICIAIWFLWGLFTFPLIRWLLGVEDMSADTSWTNNPIYLVYQWFPTMLVLSYIVGTQVRYGQTVGMSSWKLRLVTDEGKNVGVKQALPRAILSILGVGMLFSLFNKKKLGWHDMVTQTRVVLLPEKSPMTKSSKKPKNN